MRVIMLAIFVCVDVRIVLAGFSDDGLTLDIRAETLGDDIVVLRSDLATGKCKVEKLNVYQVEEFNLTLRDIDILQLCPLLSLELYETSCLSPSLGDLSSLEYLEILQLDRCHNTDFTITDLPASLQRLDIEGLNRENFQLNETSGMFEDMLETSLEMYVNNASMCSSGILSAIFGQRFMNGI